MTAAPAIACLGLGCTSATSSSPLGIEPEEQVDEVRSALRHAAARGTLALDVADGVPIVVDGIVSVRDGGEIAEGALLLRGTAVELLESGADPGAQDPVPA